MSSWIIDLADKAENILNKIDKNAATALQQPVDTIASNKLEVINKSLLSSTTPSPTKVLSTPLSQNKNNNALQDKGETGIEDSNMSREHQCCESDIKLCKMTSDVTYSLLSNSINLDTQELKKCDGVVLNVTAEGDVPNCNFSASSNDQERILLLKRQADLKCLTQCLTEERNNAQKAYKEAQATNMALMHSISALESNLAKLQQEYNSVKQKLEMQIKETEHHRIGLQEYRTKAQRTLQVKDNLIAELKTKRYKNSRETQLKVEDNETSLMKIEYDALKLELEQFLEEQHKLQLQLDKYKLQDHHKESRLIEEKSKSESLYKDLVATRENCIVKETEYRVLAQELNAVRKQLGNYMTASAIELQAKEQELQHLKSQQGQKMIWDGNKSKIEYENRLVALTQSLYEKQSVLEAVTAERNALRLQYEKAQMQKIILKGELESQRISIQENSLISNSTDDVKAQFPVLLHPNPFDNRVARRVKRAYSTLDSAGIRLGAFLRHYPLMRICLLVYVALLHLWVMFVLLSTTPN